MPPTTESGAWFTPFSARRAGRTVGQGKPNGLEGTMTKHEHEAQRNLVLRSLLLCPAGDRHEGKGHEAKDHDPHERH